MPYDWISSAEIALIAFLAGAFGSMVGLGGGLFLVPALISLFSVPDHHARFAGLVAVCVTSLSGSLVYIRQNITDMSSAAFLQLPTAIGAVVGTIVGKQVDVNVLRSLFALLLIYTAWRMIRKPGASTGDGPLRRQLATAWFACVGGGVLSAMLGVGGGIVFAPVLVLLLAKEQRVASATSTYLIALTAAGSGLLYAPDIPTSAIPNVVLPGAFGVLIGAQVGAVLSGKVSGEGLRKTLAVGVIATAVSLVVKVVSSVG